MGFVIEFILLFGSDRDGFQHKDTESKAASFILRTIYRRMHLCGGCDCAIGLALNANMKILILQVKNGSVRFLCASLCQSGRYIGSNIRPFVIVICFRFAFFSAIQNPYRRLFIEHWAKRQYGVPFASIFIFSFPVWCRSSHQAHNNMHTNTSSLTINVHFREGWLSILGNALYNICHENGPMRSSRLLSPVCVIQYKLHAFASSSSSPTSHCFEFRERMSSKN